MNIQPKQWCIIKTDTRKELIAEEILKRVGITVSVPIEEKERKNGRRAKTKPGAKHEPVILKYALFSRYVFIDAQDLNIDRIRDAPTVRGFVMDGDRLAKVSDVQLSAFKTPIAAPLNRHRGFQARVEVRIKTGPFKTFEAVIDSVRQGVAELTVYLFGRPTIVRIGLDELELV